MLESLTFTSVLVALLASLSGSLHCLGMCGPIRWLAGKGGGLPYQAGRLAAYLLLGGVAGLAGSALPVWALLALILLGVGLSFVPPHFQGVRKKVLLFASGRPWLLGLVSGILPCGLLHGWIAAAAATGNAYTGALLLSMLWVGSLPALEGSARFLPLERWRHRFPRALPMVLLMVALLPLVLRVSHISGSGEQCHHQEKTTASFEEK